MWPMRRSDFKQQRVRLTLSADEYHEAQGPHEENICYGILQDCKILTCEGLMRHKFKALDSFINITMIDYCE